MDQPHRTGPIVHWAKSKPTRVRARECLRPRASEAPSQASSIQDRGLRFEMFETSETLRVRGLRDHQVRDLRDHQVRDLRIRGPCNQSPGI
jgi:hypothetical protein